MSQIFGGAADVGPDMKEPPIIFVSIPGFAICSVPGEPNISPAAIGLIEVKLFGCFSRSYRLPRAFKIASGQQSPLEEFTAITYLQLD